MLFYLSCPLNQHLQFSSWLQMFQTTFFEPDLEENLSRLYLGLFPSWTVLIADLGTRGEEKCLFIQCPGLCQLGLGFSTDSSATLVSIPLPSSCVLSLFFPTISQPQVPLSFITSSLVMPSLFFCIPWIGFNSFSACFPVYFQRKDLYCLKKGQSGKAVFVSLPSSRFFSCS